MHGRAFSVLFFALAFFFTATFGLTVVGCSADDPVTASDAGTNVVPVDATPADTRPAYKLASVVSTRATRVALTFAAPPNPVEAAVLANYSIPGLTLGGTPALTGNVVTLETSAQTAQVYSVSVANVTRASDGKTIEGGSSFTGRTAFNVVSAVPATSVTVAITFDAVPDATSATTLANFAIAGLTLEGTPVLVDKTVTVTTSAQSVAPYPVTVASVTRAADGEPLQVATTSFNGNDTFNVLSASSGGNKALKVTFDGPPKPAQVIDAANFAVPGLTLTGPGVLAGNTVTFTTDAQLAQQYSVTVGNVTRATDSQVLTTKEKTFLGRTSFNLTSAASTRSTRVVLTFDANPAFQADNPASYSIPGLTVSAASRSNNVVTLTTSAQAAQDYEVVVSSSVVRAADSESLTTNTGSFIGRLPFSVTSAAAVNNVSMSVTFSDAPNLAFATALGSYSVAPLLVLSGTPALSGDTVTINTAGQTAQLYTVTVAGVTRASDGEPLTVTTATFNGIAIQTPTVTNVLVVSTSPDNGTTPYATGTVTVQIIGTDFASTVCPTGVKLDDKNTFGSNVGTVATSCTVNSNTQITATFPANIWTNGVTGWNVLVKNDVGTNGTSAVKLVPVAGLVISEVVVSAGSGGGAGSREYVEVYNRTTKPVDVTAAGLNLHLHVLDANFDDVDKQLTFVTTGVVPSHGFLLLSSTGWASGTAFTKRDATFTAGLAANMGVYISTSATAFTKALDKVGWGTSAVGGYYEGALLPTPANDASLERKMAGGLGHDVDTDDNLADFDSGAAMTPRGTVDSAEP